MNTAFLSSVLAGDLLVLQSPMRSRLPVLCPRPGTIDQPGVWYVKNGAVGLVLSAFHDPDSSVRVWWFYVLCEDTIGWVCDIDLSQRPLQ